MDVNFYMELRKAAEIRFPDEKERDQYLNGFIEKLANFFTDEMGEKGSLAENFLGRGVAQNVGKALVGGVAAAGFTGLMGLVNSVKGHALYNKYLQALNEATQSNTVLRSADKKKLMNFGNTIFKFAPHVATDANVLTNILANAVHGDALDTVTIRMLTELEGRYQSNSESESFNLKKWM